jgi:hypothetical protein
VTCTCSSGSGQPQPQRTHGLPGTPGSKVSFKCHTEPFRIYSEDAQLRVQLKSAHLGSGNTTSSGDHVVGQVHVPMACLEAPAKDAPCSPHTIVAPVYSHAALGSSLHSHHGEEGDETGGRWVMQLCMAVAYVPLASHSREPLVHIYQLDILPTCQPSKLPAWHPSTFCCCTTITLGQALTRPQSKPMAHRAGRCGALYGSSTGMGEAHACHCNPSISHVPSLQSLCQP